MSEAATQEVWRFVQDLNRTWTRERNPQKLAGYFHERMVGIAPMDRLRREGRAACIEGWQQFMETATIHSWKEADPKVDLFADGSCAVVTYYYEMDVEMRGQRMTLSGRDMFTLVNEDGGWWAVANQFSGYPGRQG